ncbi:MAG: hypothetical protein CM1200mP18_17920 [Gammaproteobacteria bacterium]|nr:MAG: hypothetical protein CM1200mP18_17920 [Gammaproteobacteria bacterium]
MGYTPKLDHDEPAVVSAIQQILEAPKRPAYEQDPLSSPAYAREMISMGFDLVTVAATLGS